MSSVTVDLRLRCLDDFFRSIAAWVLLWHPLEALVFNRWDFRLDRRVLRTIRYKATVRVEPLDLVLDA